MTKPKRPKYETIQYQPPTPQVFGNAAPNDLPTAAPKMSSFQLERPKGRPKLADRLAVYEDDNPKCQQMLCLGGILFPPLWIVGAVLYLRTPTTKVLTREVGFKNLLLSGVTLIVIIIFLIYHIFFAGPLAAGAVAPAPVPSPPAPGGVQHMVDAEAAGGAQRSAKAQRRSRAEPGCRGGAQSAQ
eukprot:CAMPEP_0115395420 /NCGR_PEP_ID=MMETSP0271-20121206/12777_1 /TAXON_ID=71861 /ORGANISM="Scrippsiella trochoidea, Strain CCMP3099" /LENGTH=184 /DNA_ID=CAMNT_0002819131 /DNA_START=28 /DNA_END=583 /DNA_ORIENTATION=+